MEDKKFYLNLKYNNKQFKFHVNDTKKSLQELMINVKNTKVFILKDMIDSEPIEYIFAKIDDKLGHNMLYPKIGGKLMYLQDYNIQNGDTLIIVPSPIAG